MPDLKNVGAMSFSNLNDILNQFPKDKVNIVKSNIIIKVLRTDHPGTLLSAAKIAPATWHVRAVPGLIQQA